MELVKLTEIDPGEMFRIPGDNRDWGLYISRKDERRWASNLRTGERRELSTIPAQVFRVCNDSYVYTSDFWATALEHSWPQKIKTLRHYDYRLTGQERAYLMHLDLELDNRILSDTDMQFINARIKARYFELLAKEAFSVRKTESN